VLRIPKVGRAVPPFGSDFVHIEATGGLILLVAVIAAMVWANASPAGYISWWNHHLTLGLGDASITNDARHWVNDGLMAVFFFVVGLEVKRELVVGELRDRRTAALPVVAALGGMAVPALLFAACNLGGAGARGWAIPMATDIAFVVGVMALLGDRVPRGVKLFVLSLAIVDDIGAVVVIAVFYAGGVHAAWLAGAAVTLLVVLLMARRGVERPVLYLVPAMVLWVCTFHAGVEATLAGLAVGLAIPARSESGFARLQRLEDRSHLGSTFLVVPVFALANAGLLVDRAAASRALASPIALGIGLGLVVGKLVGISTATWFGVRAGLGRLPADVGRREVAGLAALAGMGFTVSLFVADLSFSGHALADAKLGIFGASLVAAGLGAAILTWAARRRRELIP